MQRFALTAEISTKVVGEEGGGYFFVFTRYMSMKDLYFRIQVYNVSMIDRSRQSRRFVVEWESSRRQSYRRTLILFCCHAVWGVSSILCLPADRARTGRNSLYMHMNQGISLDTTSRGFSATAESLVKTQCRPITVSYTHLTLPTKRIV